MTRILALDPPGLDEAVFDCFVPGEPVAQGSKKAFLLNEKQLRQNLPVRPIINIVEANDKELRPWREMMRIVFNARMHSRCVATIDGPLSLSVVYILPRLGKHGKKEGRIWADTSFDMDKLTRAVKDSLQSSGVIVNDSRVCEYREPFYKRHAKLNEKTGVYVALWRLK